MYRFIVHLEYDIMIAVCPENIVFFFMINKYGHCNVTILTIVPENKSIKNTKLTKNRKLMNNGLQVT